MLCDTDHLHLFKLHSSKVRVLFNSFHDAERKAMLHGGDGFAGIKTILPSPPRHALVPIDPPFESEQDYVRTAQSLQDSLQRFTTGMYAVWYPSVQQREATQFPSRLEQLHPKDWLYITLTIQHPVGGDLDPHGNGMFIVNPPWALKAQLQEVMSTLMHLLGQNNGARFMLEDEFG